MRGPLTNRDRSSAGLTSMVTKLQDLGFYECGSNRFDPDLQLADAEYTRLELLRCP